MSKITVSLNIDGTLLALALEKANRQDIEFTSLVEYMLAEYLDEEIVSKTMAEWTQEDAKETSPFNQEERESMKRLAEQFGIALT